MMKDVPSLLLPMHYAFAYAETATWLLVASFAMSCCMLTRLILADWRNAFRPIIMCAGMLLVFYIAPAIVYSGHYHYELSKSSWSITLLCLPLLLCVWAYVTSRMWCLQGNDSAPPNKILLYGAILPWAVLMLIYCAHVPLSCTALYAMVTDAKYTLFARELSVKILGSNAATYAYSMLISTGAPLALWAISFSTTHAIRNRKFLLLLPYTIIFICIFASLLLNGAKGNLIPSAVTLAVCGLLMPRKWIQRILAVIGVALVFAGGLYGIDNASRLPFNIGHYPLTACVQKLGVCDRVLALLDSMKRPEGALGMGQSDIRDLQRGFATSCPTPVSSEKPQKTAPKYSANTDSDNAYYEALEARKIPRFSSIEAILYRAFVTPSQVASWYYLDQSEHGNRGITAISAVQRFSGTSFSMAEDIYQNYGRIYAGGDTTASSTAPTSFLMSYPAYLGSIGMIAAALLLLIYDAFSCLLIRYTQPPLSYVAAGLLAVSSFNMITSDFFTVMLSHGAVFGGLLVFILAALNRRALPTNR